MRFLATSLFFSFAVALGAPGQQAAAPQAEQLYLAGARSLDKGDLAAAQADFAQARQLAPDHPEYAQAFELARSGRVAELVRQAAQARMGGQPAQADALLSQARALDPGSELVQQHSATAPPRFKVEEVASRDTAFAAPIEVVPKPGAQDLHFRGPVGDVVRQVAQLYGVRVVVDSSVTPSDPIRFDLDGSAYAEAMQVLLRMNHLFGVALDAKTLLVVKDTQDNRANFERQAEETIYVPGSTQEQLNEIQNIVKNVFDVTKISVQGNSSALIVRAPQPTLLALNYTLADLLDGGAQVMLEIKLISVDKTRERSLGFSPPNSISAFSIASEAQNIVTTNQSLINTAIQQGLFTPTGNAATDIVNEALYLLASGLATDSLASGLIAKFGGGLTTGGVSLGSASTFNLALNASDARALEDITIRAGDRQQSILRIGSKYPITTSTYSSGLSAATTSALAGVSVNGTSAASLLNQYLGNSSTATIPQIQYEDLGLTLKTTPATLKDGMITLAVDMKLESLTGTTNNNIPILTSRVFTSTITVPDGTPAMLVSLISKTESLAISGVPGLGSLPGFQGTLADRDAMRDTTDLVVIVTPHVVRRRSNTLAGPRIAFQTSTPQEF